VGWCGMAWLPQLDRHLTEEEKEEINASVLSRAGLPAEYRSLFSRGPHLHEMKLAVSFMVESATMVCPSTSLHSPPLLRRKESPMRLTILI